MLITGATGFVGGHLAEALLDRDGYELHGLCRRGVWPNEWAHLANKVSLRSHDLAARHGLVELLAEVRPDWVFHLAGYAHAGRSHHDAEAAWRDNLDATRRLFEAIKTWGGRPRILAVSSGLIYGSIRGLCDESRPMQPASPYAASKAAADLTAFQFAASENLDIVRVRPFNHTGPRQSADYAIPHFASQIAAVENGKKDPIVETGDLSALRDISDVRDVVRAYILLLRKGRGGAAYNVGLGHCVRIGEALNRLLALSSVRIEVRSRSDERPPDTSDVRCDLAKIRRETGWSPQIPLDKTLRDTLDYWRGVVQQL